MKNFAFVLSLLSLSAFAQINTTAPVSSSETKICAVVFNSLNHQYSSKVSFTSNAAVADLNQVQMSTGGNWDNRISKVMVAQGCSFIGYQYQDFNIHYNNGYDLQGFALVLSNESHQKFKTSVLVGENEKISSIKCFCRN